jgi:hypothetical protein
MTHLFVFIAIIAVIAGYARFWYRFWCKHERTFDKEEAAFMSFGTCMATAVACAFLFLLWTITR